MFSFGFFVCLESFWGETVIHWVNGSLVACGSIPLELFLIVRGLYAEPQSETCWSEHVPVKLAYYPSGPGRLFHTWISLGCFVLSSLVLVLLVCVPQHQSLGFNPWPKSLIFFFERIVYKQGKCMKKQMNISENSWVVHCHVGGFISESLTNKRKENPFLVFTAERICNRKILMQAFREPRAK